MRKDYHDKHRTDVNNEAMLIMDSGREGRTVQQINVRIAQYRYSKRNNLIGIDKETLICETNNIWKIHLDKNIVGIPHAPIVFFFLPYYARGPL